MQLLNTLYVTQPESYLRLENDTLRVEVEREVRLRVPLHHLSGVVCFGHVGLSAPLMHRLADDGIALRKAVFGQHFDAGEIGFKQFLQQWQRAKGLPLFVADETDALAGQRVEALANREILRRHGELRRSCRESAHLRRRT